MSCKAFAQLQEFLRHAEVSALYSSIRKLPRPKLEEALRIRGLSSSAGDDDDESALRVRLLYFEVQFYHPEIKVPNVRLSEEEATALRAGVEALRDLARMICVESVDTKSEDATVKTEQAVSTVEPPTDTTVYPDQQVKYRLNCIKLLKVCDLQYSGARGLPAQEFLESLEDFRRFSKVDDRALLEILPCALNSSIRKWYRSSSFTDWSSFKRKFVEDHVSVPKGPRTPEGSPKRAPVTRTLEQLKNSLLEIGFSTPNASSSRRTSVCSDASIRSTLPSDEAPKVIPTHQEIRATVVPSADGRDNDKPQTFSRTIGSGVQILKRSDIVAKSNNNNSNVVTNASVNIMKPVSYATVNAGYAYGPICSPGAVSLNQINYPTSQAANCPYAVYRYANEYYVPNGYGHFSCS